LGSSVLSKKKRYEKASLNEPINPGNLQNDTPIYEKRVKAGNQPPTLMIVALKTWPTRQIYDNLPRCKKMAASL